jgi:thiol:disulfide interchange protein DsbD
VATSGKIIPGFLYLFVFAMGLGSLFVLIGTFAGALAALPKAGGWMEHIKHFFGVIMIAVAYYMARPLIPQEWFLLLIGFGLLALAAFFDGFHRLEKDAEFFPRWVKAITTFMIVGGVFYTLLGLARLNGVIGDGTKNQGAVVVAAPESKGSEAAGIPWIHNDEAAAMALSVQSGKPVMVDFWATWCVACEELDHKTFSDPVVAKFIAAHFVPLKVDGTKVNGPVKQVWARYGVKGLPTILFLRPDGSEIERFEAYRTVEETMPVLKRVAG